MSDKVILDACCGNRMMWLNKKHPVILTYLDRALRALPEKHPDVKRLGRDIYVTIQFEKSCEQDVCRERLRRMGGSGARIINEVNPAWKIGK